MQRMFAVQTSWDVPWMKRVLPAILRIASIYRRTACLAPYYLALVPEFLELVPLAQVIDKISTRRFRFSRSCPIARSIWS
jgi:hypothetical protein